MHIKNIFTYQEEAYKLSLQIFKNLPRPIDFCLFVKCALTAF